VQAEEEAQKEEAKSLAILNQLQAEAAKPPPVTSHPANPLPPPHFSLFPPPSLLNPPWGSRFRV